MQARFSPVPGPLPSVRPSQGVVASRRSQAISAGKIVTDIGKQSVFVSHERYRACQYPVVAAQAKKMLREKKR